MKFAERVLILMYVMGFYLAVFRRPAQPDLAFISTAGLALVQLLFMPFLLQQATLKDVITRQPNGRLLWHEWVLGWLFGIASAYTVFSLLYHNLLQMTSEALTENCGALLIVSAGIAAVFYRRNHAVFYRRMLFRICLLAALVMLSLILHHADVSFHK